MDPDGHPVSAAPILAPQGVGPGRRASGLPIGCCRARRRRLAETCYPGPCVINPCAAASSGRVGVPPPTQQTVRVPADPRTAAARVGVRPAGCPPALSAQSGFVGPDGGWLGARRRVENLVSSGLGRRTQGGAPSSAQAGAPPSARGDQPSQPRRLYTPPQPPLLPPNPYPALHPIPPIFQSLGSLPRTSRLPLFPFWSPCLPQPHSLTHPGAIFRPPSLPSSTSPILGSFPRQPWPSPTPPGVGGWVCMWRAGEGSWGHWGGEPRRGTRAWRAGWGAAGGRARCLSYSVNGGP